VGILKKVFSKSEPENEQTTAAEPVAEEERPECMHGVLVARWDNAADLGDQEKASSFTCEACGSTFSPEEARVLRESLADRLVGQKP
jgi:hypothetical protein